jgi:hypothetical protein
VHDDEGDEHADGQHDDGDERTADMQQEHGADQRDDEALLEERVRQRVDGPQDEVGAVVNGLNRDALEQAWSDLRNLLLDVLDDV